MGFGGHRRVERSAVIRLHQFDSPLENFGADPVSERIVPFDRIISDQIRWIRRRIFPERIKFAAHLRLFQTFLDLEQFWRIFASLLI